MFRDLGMLKSKECKLLMPSIPAMSDALVAGPNSNVLFGLRVGGHILRHLVSQLLSPCLAYDHLVANSSSISDVFL